MMKTAHRKKMYFLLEEMLKSAELKDKSKVLRINKSLEPLIIHEQKKYKSMLGLDYDNCRQSCILPFTLLSGLPEMYDKQIADARKRFSKIKERY